MLPRPFPASHWVWLLALEAVFMGIDKEKNGKVFLVGYNKNDERDLLPKRWRSRSLYLFMLCRLIVVDLGATGHPDFPQSRFASIVKV